MHIRLISAIGPGNSWVFVREVIQLPLISGAGISLRRSGGSRKRRSRGQETRGCGVAGVAAMIGSQKGGIKKEEGVQNCGHSFLNKSV
jgi:hypothetical protein